MGLSKTDQLTNAKPSAIYSLDWQPLTLSINNVTKFPVYVFIGTTSIPGPRAFTDVIAPFTSYVRDPNGARDFGIRVDTSTDPGAIFPFPVVINFSTGAASSQVPSSIIGGIPSTVYITKVEGIRTASLIDFWAMDDSVLSIALDRIATIRNAAYVASPTLQAVLGPDGSLKAPAFNGTTQYVDFRTPSFTGTWNPALGTLLIWVQMTATEWLTSTPRQIAKIFVDASNFLEILKNNTSSINISYFGTATGATQGVIPPGDNNWLALVITWNRASNRFRAYMNGVQQGLDHAIGNWIGTPTVCTFGVSEVPSRFIAGNMAMGAIWTAELSASEVLAISTAP